MTRFFLRSALAYVGLIKKPDLVVTYTADQPVPGSLVLGELTIVGKKQSPKWAVLHCPGGCGNIMRLPLNPNQKPSWTVSVDWLGRPSATPSVHQRNACHAHYWIRNGAVVWCKDSGCGESG